MPQSVKVVFLVVVALLGGLTADDLRLRHKQQDTLFDVKEDHALEHPVTACDHHDGQRWATPLRWDTGIASICHDDNGLIHQTMSASGYADAIAKVELFPIARIPDTISLQGGRCYLRFAELNVGGTSLSPKGGVEWPAKHLADFADGSPPMEICYQMDAPERFVDITPEQIQKLVR